MPTYCYRDTNTGEEFDVLLKLAEKDKFEKDFPHFQQVLSAPNIVSGVGGIKNDAGWNELMSKVAEKAPDTNFGRSVNRAGNKQAKINAAVEKWRNKTGLSSSD